MTCLIGVVDWASASQARAGPPANDTRVAVAVTVAMAVRATRLPLCDFFPIIVPRLFIGGAPISDEAINGMTWLFTSFWTEAAMIVPISEFGAVKTAGIGCHIC